MKGAAQVCLAGVFFLLSTTIWAQQERDREAAQEKKVGDFVKAVDGSCRVGRDPATNRLIFEVKFPSGVKLKKKAFADLPSLPHLVGVDLTGVDLIDSPFEVLARCKDLRCLNLSSTQHAEKGFSGIENLKDLEDLDLSNSSIGDADLAHVGKLVHLTRLVLYNSRKGQKVTDRGLAHLAPLSKLKILDLSYLPITDAGVAELARIKSLEAIDLSNAFGITDKSIPVLRKMPRLKYIRLQPTGISGNGGAELMRRRPDVKVVF